MPAMTALKSEKFWPYQSAVNVVYGHISIHTIRQDENEVFCIKFPKFVPCIHLIVRSAPIPILTLQTHSFGITDSPGITDYHLVVIRKTNI